DRRPTGFVRGSPFLSWPARMLCALLSGWGLTHRLHDDLAYCGERAVIIEPCPPGHGLASSLQSQDAGEIHMAAKDPRIDVYIEQAADFAKPILTRLRKLVHKGCPDVVETIKWGMPAFDYKGPLCGMAAFKQHCAF